MARRPKHQLKICTAKQAMAQQPAPAALPVAHVLPASLPYCNNCVSAVGARHIVIINYCDKVRVRLTGVIYLSW